MSVQRGDVVLIDAPFVTRPGTKTRPMLVVQNDTNNGRMANTIVALITTNLSRISEPTQVLIDVTSPAGRQSGLFRDSAVSCENLLTIRQSQIIATHGSLPPDVMRQVDDCLKVSLALP